MGESLVKRGERIVMGGDHRGFALKRELARRLADSGFAVDDLGPPSEASVDYPDFAAPAAREVSEGRAPRGIVICGSGLGVMYAANRFPRVRAALVHDVETAIAARQHNDANVLALAGDRTDPETAWKIVRAWLETPFEGGRHGPRVAKIDSLTRESEAETVARSDREVGTLLRRGERSLAVELDLRPDAGLPTEAVLHALRAPIAEDAELAEEARRLAETRASERFGAPADLRAASGDAARALLLRSLLAPGDTLLAVGEPPEARGVPLGVRWIALPLDPASGRIDLETLAALARREGPKVLLVEARDLVRWPDWTAVAAVAQNAGALLAVDLGGLAGLVAAGALASPLGVAAVAGATDGTLRGPRGGFVVLGAAARELASPDASDAGVPDARDLVARAVAFGAAGTSAFRAEAARAIDAARALAAALASEGFAVATGGTDTARVDVDRPDGDAAALRAELARAGLHCAAPHATRLSFGTAAAAARGIGGAELVGLAGDLRMRELDAATARPVVEALARRFPGAR
jgi:RpiB/LacA/LacB family sugar-phosphate isomerase